MFDVYSPIWAALLIAVSIGVAAAPLMKWAVNDDVSATRVATVDGLRGFLALAVMAHHAAIYASFSQGGPWVEPPDRFYAGLGPVGVSIFFMITAYLFWGRIIGPKPMDWRGLYIGRVFRIAPLYLVVAIIVLAVTFVNTHYLTPGFVVRWLSLGALSVPGLDGFESWQLIAGVAWSLQFEWLFYFALLPLALFKRWHLPFAALGFGVALIKLQITGTGMPPTSAALALFFAGMLCASIQARYRVPLPGPKVSSVIVVALMGSLFIWPAIYASIPIVTMGIAFFLITQGSSVFGLLLTPAARRLGDISFGVYLIHGLALAALFYARGLWAEGSPTALSHWAVSLLALLVTIAASLLAHRFLERPGIAMGRTLIARVNRTRAAKVSIPIEAEAP